MDTYAYGKLLNKDSIKIANAFDEIAFIDRPRGWSEKSNSTEFFKSFIEKAIPALNSSNACKELKELAYKEKERSSDLFDELLKESFKELSANFVLLQDILKNESWYDFIIVDEPPYDCLNISKETFLSTVEKIKKRLETNSSYTQLESLRAIHDDLQSLLEKFVYDCPLTALIEKEQTSGGETIITLSPSLFKAFDLQEAFLPLQTPPLWVAFEAMDLLDWCAKTDDSFFKEYSGDQNKALPHRFVRLDLNVLWGYWMQLRTILDFDPKTEKYQPSSWFPFSKKCYKKYLTMIINALIFEQQRNG